MVSKVIEQRDNRLRSLTSSVQYFDPSNVVHIAHYNVLKQAFGEMGAAMLVSQDAEQTNIRFVNGLAPSSDALELTDAGAVNTHHGWRQLNRVVRHGSVSRFTVYDFDADTKVGGRLIPLFTREQTVPAHAQD